MALLLGLGVALNSAGERRAGMVSTKRYGYGWACRSAGRAGRCSGYCVVLGARASSCDILARIASVIVRATAILDHRRCRTTSGGWRWRWGKED